MRAPVLGLADADDGPEDALPVHHPGGDGRGVRREGPELVGLHRPSGSGRQDRDTRWYGTSSLNPGTFVTGTSRGLPRIATIASSFGPHFSTGSEYSRSPSTIFAPHPVGLHFRTGSSPVIDLRLNDATHPEAAVVRLRLQSPAGRSQSSRPGHHRRRLPIWLLRQRRLAAPLPCPPPLPFARRALRRQPHLFVVAWLLCHPAGQQSAAGPAPGLGSPQHHRQAGGQRPPDASREIHQDAGAISAPAPGRLDEQLSRRRTAARPWCGPADTPTPRGGGDHTWPTTESP